MRLLHTPVLGAAIALGGCAVHAVPGAAPPPSIVPPDAPWLAATRPAVERLLAAEAQRLKLPSLAFGVVTRWGLVYFVGLGAREEGGAPPTADTIYRIGSVTKTFTGMALLQLRDAGKLHFDDPVIDHLPELAGARLPSADAGPIRIRHLVTHSSGLPRLGSLHYWRAEVTRADLRDAARGAVLEFAPGTRAVYSNLAMALAGPIVAHASGEPYRAYVERHILAPLGMTHTVWERDAVPPGALAQAWTEKDGAFVGAGEHWRLGAAEAMGGLYSNVADMSRYVAFQLSAWPPRDGPDDGPLRRSSVRESQVLAGFSLPGGEGFGVNWIIRNEQRLGHLVFHNGATEGYHAIVYMLPSRGLGVIALGPSTMKLDGLALKALTEIVAAAPDLLGKPKPASLPSPAEPKPAPPLGPPAEAALARVRALLVAADRAAIEQAFAPDFLKAHPPDEAVAFFTQVRGDAGACSEVRVVDAPSPDKAEVELGCERATIRVQLQAEPEAPHRLIALRLEAR